MDAEDLLGVSETQRKSANQTARRFLGGNERKIVFWGEVRHAECVNTNKTHWTVSHTTPGCGRRIGIDEMPREQQERD